MHLLNHYQVIPSICYMSHDRGYLALFDSFIHSCAFILQLVRDLDQKLEVSKKFFPRDGSPQLLQKQHGTTSDPGTATTSDPGNTMTSELRTGTTSDPRTVAQANMSSLLMSVRRQLEQSEKQLAGEVMLRGQFLQTLADQQDLIDTIAAVS